jgi:hypothetical protein
MWSHHNSLLHAITHLARGDHLTPPQYSGTFVGIDHAAYTHSSKSQLSYFGTKLGGSNSDRIA